MTNPNQDGWDWPYILYVGRKWLGYTDQQTWALTPRQFMAPLSAHEDVTRKANGVSDDRLTASARKRNLDQIPGW